MAGYLRPRDLTEALAALAEGPRVVVAGATDHYPARVGRLPDEDILDVTAIAGLRAIEPTDGGWRIGALTTWTDLVETPLPPAFDGLRRAARAVGGLQIQNRATLAGNVCNASPAADGIPNLLALDAAVELASVRGVREVPVGAFVTGNRRTVREPDELVTAILVPAAAGDARSTFRKLGARSYLVISIAMVAAVVELETQGGAPRVAAARIAVGACSVVARRLAALESELAGRPLDRALADVVRPEHLAGLTPIDDIRGTAEYRRDAAGILIRRALRELAA